MRHFKYFVLLGVLLAALTHGRAEGQISVGIGVGGYGPAPICDYGYYNSVPYACAPYGYYGPEWFDNGLFIGVGPWYRGYGYRGFGGYRGYGFRGGYGGGYGYGGYRGWEGRGYGYGPVNRGTVIAHGGEGYGGGYRGGQVGGGGFRGGASRGGGGGGFHGGGRR